MKKSTVLPILIVILLAVCGFLFNSNLIQKRAAPLTSSAPLPTSIKLDTSDLGRGGVSFNDPNGVYGFLYPLDYKLDSQNDGKQVRIYKPGATQQGQTEMYDGVILVFESVTLDGKSLDRWTSEYIKNATADGTTEVTKPKTPIKINSFSGYTYKVRGLGEYTNIVLQKEKSSDHAVIITSMVADPQKVGFQNQVDKILSTLKLLQ